MVRPGSSKIGWYSRRNSRCWMAASIERACRAGSPKAMVLSRPPVYVGVYWINLKPHLLPVIIQEVDSVVKKHRGTRA